MVMKVKLVSKQQYPQLKKLYKEFDVGEEGDICIAVGGDGTFIKAAREFDGPILPVRSEEVGSTGYYSDIGLSKIDIIIERIKHKKYRVEDLSRKLEIRYKDKVYYAINEALLRNKSKEIYFNVYTVENGRKRLLYPYTVSGDGLLITGKVGSTAYNRTAGGPIILSQDIICVNFLYPESLFTNPLVISGDSDIYIELAKSAGTLMTDSIEIADLSVKESFYVRQSKKTVKIIRLDGFKEEFSEKLARMIQSKMVDGLSSS
ncbi:MAG: NAD(+)/NADH kinase [Candidatus Parvarchaeota archaeon]|nr:NAD(+)/NADH kinase [Candidatus Parvarchaeota archaeon]MCL5101217.1 NAD(+)/NADH kinase [Candidatus Parvarchaeota archaeon]